MARQKVLCALLLGLLLVSVKADCSDDDATELSVDALGDVAVTETQAVSS